MPDQKPSRVIIDTNLWVSFLIGRELKNLTTLIVNDRIKLITTVQQIEELTVVTSRPKLKKYFDQDKVTELIALLTIVSENVFIRNIESLCRDPKDDFLLALSKAGKADFLITGDKDLLSIKVYGGTEIVTVKKFREKVK
jgi:hypothetical protein